MEQQSNLHDRLYDDFIWGLKFRPKHPQFVVIPFGKAGLNSKF